MNNSLQEGGRRTEEREAAQGPRRRDSGDGDGDGVDAGQRPRAGAALRQLAECWSLRPGTKGLAEGVRGTHQSRVLCLRCAGAGAPPARLPR